jgi:hypothetical protein
MYKVSYYLNGGGILKYKFFETLHEATFFSNLQSIDSVIEIKLYENSSNNRSALRS